MKILVADDDQVSGRLMQRMLERSGYEVVLATDGQAALLELTNPEGPKLALIDWMMPELDGLGVCRETRGRHDESYIYIVLLTSKQTNADIVEGLEAGADDYLTKPCNPAELNARLLTGRRILGLEEKLVEAREGMRFRAMHDGLTQLLNRTAILGQVSQSLSRSVREGVPASILLCDIDHFKQVNDTYGHLAGDAVLEIVASRLQGVVRENDYVGRYGGEEFVVVLNGCDDQTLTRRAEEVRHCFADQKFAIPGNTLRVTSSIGAVAIGIANNALSAEAIIDQADEALYRAKAEGRNCVRFAEPEQPTESYKPITEMVLLLQQNHTPLHSL